MTLEEIRREIDGIDAQLLPLLQRRMDCAKQVADYKAAHGLPVFNAAREEQILERVAAQAGEYSGEARLFYATLMEMSRALQHRRMQDSRALRKEIAAAPRELPPVRRVACQGAAGAYSHEAALRLFPQAEPCFYASFGDVVRAVEAGDVDLGLLPVENSSAGSVSEVYGLILEHRFFIAAATTLRVRHCLAAPPSADPARIRDVYSHRQALAQCSQFLARHGYVPQPYSNTAAAAKMAAERGGDLAVICSEQAAETHGLRILERGIQNSSGNRTRFIAISRTLTIPDDAQKISLCFSLPHTTGSLYHVLARFAVAGLNLTKIESRPISSEGRLFEYDFYLDFTGNLREEPTLEFIASLQAELPDFSFLGNYREQEEPAEALQFQKVAPPRQIETLAALASKIWHEHYTPLLGAAQVDYMVEKFQSAPALAHQMEHEGYTYYLLLLDGVPAGFMGFRPEPGKMFLSKLYVDRPYRRRHLAARALAFLREICRGQGLTEIYLTVNRHNDGSIAAYRKLGFSVAREEKADIGNGFYMDDYIMSLDV